MNKIDSILRKYYGTTGTGESFKKRVAVKPYNAEAYAEAYANVRADKIIKENHAIKMKLYITTAKARGVGEAEIFDKVKKGVKSAVAWIKKLIKNLIVMIGEFFNNSNNLLKGVEKVLPELKKLAKGKYEGKEIEFDEYEDLQGKPFTIKFASVEFATGASVKKADISKFVRLLETAKKDDKIKEAITGLAQIFADLDLETSKVIDTPIKIKEQLLSVKATKGTYTYSGIEITNKLDELIKAIENMKASAGQMVRIIKPAKLFLNRILAMSDDEIAKLGSSRDDLGLIAKGINQFKQTITKNMKYIQFSAKGIIKAIGNARTKEEEKEEKIEEKPKKKKK